MTSLRELQRAFGAALRDPAAAAPVSPAANLDVYRQHGDAQFRRILEIEFPVLLRRVGEGYFSQLAREYRRACPSRSGDLHWVGREFAAFLDRNLRDPEYRWLADLARLEWACESASICGQSPAIGPEVLAGHTPEALAAARFDLQPSLHLVESEFPVFSVWFANQSASEPDAVHHRNAERGMIRYRDNQLEVTPLSSSAFEWLSALREGLPLAAATERAGLDGAGLLQELQRVFAAALVCGVEIPKGQGLGTSS